MVLMRVVPVAMLAANAYCFACNLKQRPGLCDGASDDTFVLQAALGACPSAGSSIVVLKGARCTSQPLRLVSDTDLVIEENATIRAGVRWNASRLGDDGDIAPFVLADAVSNVTVRGKGTLDGNGADWWHHAPHRPRLLAFKNARHVRIEGVTLLNSAFWTLLLHGSHFTVAGIRIRAPAFGEAPNTDGIDVAADQVHIHDVDIINGDDCICIKSPSSNVLVERSIVSAGNGLVVGTAADQQDWDKTLNVANVTNVIFRDIIANDTTFGCHVKFHPPQHGHVRNVTFENIVVTQTAASEARRISQGDWAGYAIGLHQFDQGRRLVKNTSSTNMPVPRPTFVSIEDIVFRNITGNVQHAGQFECGALTRWLAPCRGIRLEHVHLNASVDGCVFSRVDASSTDVSPQSCVAASSMVSLETVI